VVTDGVMKPAGLGSRSRSARSRMIWLEPETFYFFFRSWSGSPSTLKNWKGAGAGIDCAAPSSSSFKKFCKI